MVRFLSAAAGLAVLCGCSCGGGKGTDGGSTTDGGGGTDSGGPYIPFSDYCNEVYQGFVNAELPAITCGSPLTTADLMHLSIESGLANTYASVFAQASCDGGQFGLFYAQFSQSLDAGRMTYDGYRAGQCRQMGEQQGAANLLNNPDSGINAFCAGAIVGTVALTGACNFSEECAGDAYCLPAGPGACGGSCVSRLAPGQRCDPNIDLCSQADVATCIDPQDGGSPSCLTPSPLGGPCALQGCQPNLLCGDVSQVCIASLAVAAGSQCQNAGGSPSDCIKGVDCVATGDGGALCMAPAAQGQPCNTDETNGTGLPNCGGACQLCLSTDGGAPDPVLGGVCTPVTPLAGACTADFQCPAGAYCLLAADGGFPGTCTRQPRTSESCALLAGTSLPDPNGEQGNCMYADTFCLRATQFDNTGVCTAIPAQAGDTCGTGPNLYLFCPGTLSCIGSGAFGTCQASPTAGQVCAPLAGVGTPCDSTSYCDGGSCVPLPSLNEDCNNAGACAGNLFCADGGLILSDGGLSTGTCLQVLAPGVACTDPNSCGTSLVCDVYTNTCLSPCTGNYTQCGCPDGARDISAYLLYAVVAMGAHGWWWKRRRKAQPRGRAPAARTSASRAS
jgi:hypothetical protein